MTRTERAIHAGPAAQGLTVMVEGRSRNRRSLHNMNKSQLARPCTGEENPWGLLHGTPTENARVMSRLIPLVLLLRLLLLILLVPLLILLLMRGLLLSRMPRLILLLLRLMRGRLLSLMPRLMLRLPLIRRVTFTVALAASAAIVASTSPAPPATSGFEASGQGMAAVGPVRAPVELLHANETILQFD